MAAHIFSVVQGRRWDNVCSVMGSPQLAVYVRVGVSVREKERYSLCVDMGDGVSVYFFVRDKDSMLSLHISEDLAQDPCHS